MFKKTIFIGVTLALLLAVALPAAAQVRLTDLMFQNKPVEPGAFGDFENSADGLAPGAGAISSDPFMPGAPAALGDGVIIFKFEARDIDPIADDASDVEITCIQIQNLGTATPRERADGSAGDIRQVMVLDQDGNSVAPPDVTELPGTTDPVNTQGCANMARTSPNAQIAWEVYFDLAARDGAGTFIIPDDGAEVFQVAVRVNFTDFLTDDSQNHTLVLKATLQLNETVGSPPAPTIFIDPVVDGAPEVVWNGGINKYSDDTWQVNPLMPGESGVVSRFTVCDYDSNEHQLVINQIFVKQGERGTAISSDITSLDLYRIDGFGLPELVASRTPDSTFDRGSGSPGGLALPAGKTAITIPDDECMVFELVAHVSPFAYKTHIIQPRFQISTEEPGAFPPEDPVDIDQSVDPQIYTGVGTVIGKGIIVLPDTKLIGKPGIIPIQIAGVAVPGMGTLQVGPVGRLEFNPKVFIIKEITGVGPYEVLSTELDNRNGHARFAISIDPNFDGDGDGNPDNPLLSALTDGTVAHIHIQPTGEPGALTRLVLTFDCFELVQQNNCAPVGFPYPDTPNQNPNNDISVMNGAVEILHPGDTDFDGWPTIRDSLLVANALLACTTSPQTNSENAFSMQLENVVWTNGSNVDIAGPNLTKNAGGSAWNAGAVSVQQLLEGDGYVETTANETNTDRVFGLSMGSADQDPDEIDFGIFLMDNGEVEVRQNGNQIIPNPAVTYNTGDIFRVEIDGDNVLYKKNGTTFLTTANVITDSSYPLLVDASLFHQGATLQFVRVAALGTDTTMGLITELTDEQKSVSDVAPPFAEAGEIPGCGELTSADVAEIARLAINHGSAPAPTAARAGVQSLRKPWYSFLSELWNRFTGTPHPAVVDVAFDGPTQTVNVGVAEVPGTGLGGIQGRVYFDPAVMTVHGVRGANGYRVLAFEVDNVLGEVRFAALTSRGQGVRQGDVLQLTVSGQSATTLGVEALIDEAALDIAYTLKQETAEAAEPVTLNVSGVQALSQANGTFVFRALGSGIAGIQVQVYDLAGGVVFDAAAAGNALQFHGLNQTGKLLANGVYLFVVTATGANGDTVRSQVNKLAILR